jgi:competence protein ComEC
MLLAAPPVLWDVGFQLSALATAGLVWFGAPLEARLARWPVLVREPVALTLAAQLTTLPVILLNFERLSLVAPLANVVVVPIVPIVMLCAALAAAVGAADALVHLPLLSELLVWACGGAAWLYLRVMIVAGQLAASLPFASVDLAAPAWLAAAWYPGLYLARGRVGPAGDGEAQTELDAAGRLTAAVLRPGPATAGTLVVLALLTLATRPDGRLHLVMLDVGQGDAILVRAPSGATLLVDGGADPDLAMRQLGAALPFWQRDLAMVLLTHPHEDHVAGLVPALERYRVRLVLDAGRAYENPTYPRFRSLAATEVGATVRLARAGDRFALDATTTLTVLFPSEADAAAPLPEGDINNASVVALLESGGFRALLTGDAEAPVERLLLDRGLLGPVDVLKVAHHGSNSGTSVAFLEVVRPATALISSGSGNDYGHPHAVTLEHLAAIRGLVVRRTDLEGTVEIVAGEAATAVRGHDPSDAGSIGPWPSRPASRQRRSWRPSPCLRVWSSTRAAWPASPPKRRAWLRRAACRSTRGSSRSPPCCMTSTS